MCVILRDLIKFNFDVTNLNLWILPYWAILEIFYKFITGLDRHRLYEVGYRLMRTTTFDILIRHITCVSRLIMPLRNFHTPKVDRDDRDARNYKKEFFNTKRVFPLISVQRTCSLTYDNTFFVRINCTVPVAVTNRRVYHSSIKGEELTRVRHHLLIVFRPKFFHQQPCRLAVFW